MKISENGLNQFSLNIFRWQKLFPQDFLISTSFTSLHAFLLIRLNSYEAISHGTDSRGKFNELVKSYSQLFQKLRSEVGGMQNEKLVTNCSLFRTASSSSFLVYTRKKAKYLFFCDETRFCLLQFHKIRISSFHLSFIISIRFRSSRIAI